MVATTMTVALYDFIMTPWSHWSQLVSICQGMMLLFIISYTYDGLNEWHDKLASFVTERVGIGEQPELWTLKERNEFLAFLSQNKHVVKCGEVELRLGLFWSYCGFCLTLAFTLWQLRVGTTFDGLEFDKL